MKSIGCKEEGVLRNHMPTSKSDLRRHYFKYPEEWFENTRQHLISIMKE
jgi:hypothetical protein